jgi:phage shock protein A
MRLFQRIGDIIAANLNDLVDRFEDPEVMLKQAIREMDTMIESATAGAARAIAGERLLSKDLSDHEQEAVRRRARAEEGVSRGDDDLARQAIARAHEHEAMAQALLEQRTSAE